jgi:hypothetical protein
LLSPCHLVLIYFLIESCVTFTWLLWHSFIVQTFSQKSFETLWTYCRLTIHCKHLLFNHEITVHRQCKMLKTAPFCLVSNRTCDLKSYFSAATEYMYFLHPLYSMAVHCQKKYKDWLAMFHELHQSILPLYIGTSVLSWEKENVVFTGR